MALADPARRRESPVFVQCVVYFAFAMPAAMLGVAWPAARHTFDQPSSALGIVAAAYGIGRLSTSASAGYLLSRFALRRSIVGACAGLAVGNVLVLAVPVWPVFLAMFLAIGVLSGVLDSLGGRYLATVRDVGGAGLMAGSYGVGATLGPAVVAFTHWRVGYGIAAAASVIAVLLAAGRAVRWPDELVVPRRRQEARGSIAPIAATSGAALPRAAVAASLGLFAVYVGIEVTAGQWAATFLEDSRGLSDRSAGIATSAFWGGITIGRLLLGRLLVPRAPQTERVLTITTTALLGALVLAAIAPGAGAVAAFALAGLALAPSFPTLMATTAERVGAAMAGRVSGWQLLAANVGGTGLAALTGAFVALTGAGAPIVVLGATAVAGLLVVRIAATVSVNQG